MTRENENGSHEKPGNYLKGGQLRKLGHNSWYEAVMLGKLREDPRFWEIVSPQFVEALIHIGENDESNS